MWFEVGFTRMVGRMEMFLLLFGLYFASNKSSWSKIQICLFLNFYYFWSSCHSVG